MKNIWLITLIIISFLSLIIIGGCTGTSTQPPVQPTSQPPAMCNSVYVVSNCSICGGTVFVNGLGTGAILLPWGGTFVTVPNLQCGQVVSVFLQSPAGWVSHSINATATSPQTVVSFDWF